MGIRYKKQLAAWYYSGVPDTRSLIIEAIIGIRKHGDRTLTNDSLAYANWAKWRAATELSV